MTTLIEETETWLKRVAVTKRSNLFGGDEGYIWVTKKGGFYLTRVGMEDKVSTLAKLGLTKLFSTYEEGKPANIGFCERDQKWYGWSHRAIYGFGIGSKVSKGDCAYTASTPEEMIEDRITFFGEEYAERTRAECQVLPDRSGIRILPAPLVIPAVAMEDLGDALAGKDVPVQQVDLNEGKGWVKKCGKGEWTAKTLADARQMAIDFAEDVA